MQNWMLTFCVNFKVDDKLGLDPFLFFCKWLFVSLLISWTFLTDVCVLVKKGVLHFFCVCAVFLFYWIFVDRC